MNSPGATVDFGDVSEVDTTATFYEPGEYVLKLTAWDDLVTAEDTVTITIRQLPFVEAGEYEPITLPVDFETYARFAKYWLETGTGLPADLHEDNTIDGLDLKVFADYWLCYCPLGWQLK